MSSHEVDALLSRLVAQFESPYDFLRELVQNAMDAGSDRVEVTLETHETGRGDEVIFELMVLDSGSGMDEKILDNELTRLFSSGKQNDRTTAGGFGIGFVSVFAWDPSLVLLQTGRGGQAWELTFFEDRTFEKVPVDMPVEGTTIFMYRRGRRAERKAIAEAIRDSLWRWCRFCPLELTFEDLAVDDVPDLIQDSPEPVQESLARVWKQGESEVRVSLGVPPRVVMLRHGLILAEGTPSQLLPGIKGQLARSVEHLRVWADSPLLRTTMARDKVVDDEGRKQIERKVLELSNGLRGELFRSVQAMAEQEAWSIDEHQRYAMLHSHLQLECMSAKGPMPKLLARPILRGYGGGRSWAVDDLAMRLKGWPVLLTSTEFKEVEERERLLAQAVRGRVPLLTADIDEDRAWLEELMATKGLKLAPLDRSVSRVGGGADGEALCSLVCELIRRAGLNLEKVRLGDFVDVQAIDPPLWGLSLGALGDKHKTPEASHAVVYGGRPDAIRFSEQVVWLNKRHLLVPAAINCYASQPLVAAMTLSAAVLGGVGSEGPKPAHLSEAASELS